MRRKLVSMTVSVVPVFLLALAAAVPVPAQEHWSGPIVTHAVHFDVSPPLRDMIGLEQPPGPPQIIPLRHRTPPQAVPSGQEDAALQEYVGPLVGTTNGLNFDGVGANGSAPPDTNGAVGATQFVQWVNTEYAVYDKNTGALVAGPFAGNNFWNGFGGACQTSNSGDPIIQYDKAAGRWVAAQPVFNSPYMYCIAVSTSSDATGSYNRYAFQFPSGDFPDYPKLGVWPDAYYASFNIFLNGFNYLYPRVCAYDRNKMLAGAAATSVCFNGGSSDFSLLPSDLDGNTAPPSGEPNFYVELDPVSTTQLDLFKFHVDFANPSNSTFTGPTLITGVTSFSQACGGGTCIPQEGTSQQLDSLGDRLMYRLAYRNFGTHESLVVNHSVTAGSSVGVRWYEIRSPNSSPTIFQQGTFAPDSEYRWMGSIAMDQAGDIAVGYSASSSSIHPAVRYTGRVPSDPPGTMESEDSIIEGSGSQTNGLSRWGDYSSMSIDPADDCTFWYTNEYLKTDGSFNWSTRIGSFKFTTCGGPPPPPPSAPFNLTASALNTYQIKLNWQEASGQNQTGFNIYRCKGAGCTNFSKITSVGGSVFTYTDGSSSNPLTENTSYSYQVTAFNGGGESGPSNTASATTQTEPAPTNLTSSAGQTGHGSHKRDFVNLSWTNHSTDADGNHIERCTGSTCTNFTEIATTGASATTYTDNSVALLTTYRYRVRAHSPGGYSAYSNTTTVTTP